MRSDNILLAVFESDLRENFFPLTLTRPTFDLPFGTHTLLGRIESRLGVKSDYLYVPDYLKTVAQENHPGTKLNEWISQRCLAISSLVSNSPQLWRALEKALSSKKTSLYVDESGRPVFAVLDELKPEWIHRNFPKAGFPARTVVQENELAALMYFPWNAVNDNGGEIERSYTMNERSLADTRSGGLETMGEKIAVSSGAEIQRFVTLDSRNGPIIIENNARIESFSYLTGPCFIGEGAVIKSGRVGHGSTISNFSRVAGEVDQSIISEYSNKSHEGYVGHSFVGRWVNLGALTTTSDLKNTYGEVKASIGTKTVKTGSDKVGAFIGDMAKTGIGTMITCGKSIGVSAHALGRVQSSVPSFTMHSDSTRASLVEIYIDSAIETQRRMMKRRGIAMSESYTSMIKKVFKLTKDDRRKQHVSKGKFS